MASLDSLLSRMEGNDYLNDDIQFNIDENLRTIAIPSNGVVLGVHGDKNVNRVNFRMPRYYNGFDMTEFETRIIYSNNSGTLNYYTVTDMIVSDDVILFTWLVDSDATAHEGIVTFGVKMLKVDTETSVILQSFNTTLAKAKVLTGMNVETSISPEETKDLISSLEKYVDDSIKDLTFDVADEKIAEMIDDNIDNSAATNDEIDTIFSEVT